MIHPETRLQFISSKMGYGVFATDFIPKGTIVYIKDELEIVISPDSPLLKRPEYESLIRKYSYIEDGTFIISWDIEKYVNHCCDSNTLSTGYGFEIAVRDIEPGIELRDDYGLFNVDYEFVCSCGASNCRKAILKKDFPTFTPWWNERLKDALSHFKTVDQPLLPYMDEEVKHDLMLFLETGHHYKSVDALREKE